MWDTRSVANTLLLFLSLAQTIYAGQGYPYPWDPWCHRGARRGMVHLQARKGGQPQEAADRIYHCSSIHRWWVKRVNLNLDMLLSHERVGRQEWDNYHVSGRSPRRALRRSERKLR